jgi:DNA repair exonuclease SbcCD ATPase subunit
LEQETRERFGAIMLLKKLKLNYFGRFNNREIELKPGINLIYGENETGKSTIHTFIKGMLFGIERMRGRGSASKEDIYTRYLPWNYPGAYQGSMDILIGDKDYRIQRSFHTNDKSFVIIDLSTGREVKLKEGLISELIPGLTEATFRNTISIEQLKAHTDTELVTHVRNYIMNLSIAKSKEVNVTKAINYLNDQRRQLEATQNMAALKELQVEIEEGTDAEAKLERLTINLQQLLRKSRELELNRERVLRSCDTEDYTRMEQLPAIIEKYHTYLEQSKQINNLELQYKELKSKIAICEQEQSTVSDLKKDLSEAVKWKEEIHELEVRLPEMLKKEENLAYKANSQQLACALPFGVVAFLLCILTEFSWWGNLLSVLVVIAGIMVFILLRRKLKHNLLGIQSIIARMEQGKEEIGGKLIQLLEKYGLHSIEELALRQEELLKTSYSLEIGREKLAELQQRSNELEDHRDTLYDTIMKYMQYYIQADELSYDAMQRLQEQIGLRKQNISDKVSEINLQSDTCKLEIERLKWEISALEGNELRLLKNRERYIELLQQQKSVSAELEAIKLALTSIQELSTEIHDSFGLQLNSAVSKVISQITDDKYSDLKIDEKLEVKVGWNGDYVLLERLSAGTIDQVYLALRLAVADLLLGEEEMPLLFDDSFALYDETRVKSVIASLSKRRQILLFTCHKREKDLLEELNIPYHYVDLTSR